MESGSFVLPRKQNITQREGGLILLIEVMKRNYIKRYERRDFAGGRKQERKRVSCVARVLKVDFSGGLVVSSVPGHKGVGGARCVVLVFRPLIGGFNYKPCCS